MHIIAKTEGVLFDLLTQLAPDSSRQSLRSWLKQGRITVDGKVVKLANTPILPGQKIALEQKFTVLEENIRILYEDRDLVAIEKPNHLLSVATAFEKEKTAHDILKSHFHPRIVNIVHRLDQDTSGVMLYALSQEGYEGLKNLFEGHDIERCYYAVVEGRLTPPDGTWESYLYEDSQYMVHSTTDPRKGRIAITHFKTMRNSASYSLIQCKLETGRKNQIRVHARDHGHPVVGDTKYGSTKNPIKRLCLHAESIAFIHPISGKRMHFSAPYPELFNKLLVL